MTYLPREIRRWVKDEELDTKTRVRFRNLADEIERLEISADKSKAAAALAAIRNVCENVDKESYEPLQAWLAEQVLAIIDGTTQYALILRQQRPERAK